jgi:hypothetical protein
MVRLAQVDNQFDYATAAAKFAAAFAAYDLDVATGDRDELAQRIATAEPDVQGALHVALDDWAFVTARAQTPWPPQKIRALAQAADKDPWRQRYRSAVSAAKLPDVLAGRAAPADNNERLAFLEVCRLQRRHAAVARLYADAFNADAKLADDLKAAHRYDAACFAALADAGQGTDADKLNDKERGQLRKQALEWLRADLTLWSKRLEEGQAADRQAIRKMLRHWQDDADLAGVRDGAALLKLPAEEQEAWRQSWADVAGLLKQTNAK